MNLKQKKLLIFGLIFMTISIIVFVIISVISDITIYNNDFYKTEVENYTQQINNNKNDYHSYKSRGHAYSQLRKYKQAIQDFETALVLSNDSNFNKSVLFIMAETYMIDNEYKESLKIINVLIRNDSDNSNYFIYAQRGLLLDFLDNKNEALKTYFLYMKKIKYEFYGSDKFKNVTKIVLFRKSLIHYNNHEYELALNDIHAAIRLEPQCGYLYYLRGMIEVKLHLNESPYFDFTKALDEGYSDQTDIIKIINGFTGKEKQKFKKLFESYKEKNKDKKISIYNQQMIIEDYLGVDRHRKWYYRFFE